MYTYRLVERERGRGRRRIRSESEKEIEKETENEYHLPNAVSTCLSMHSLTSSCYSIDSTYFMMHFIARITSHSQQIPKNKQTGKIWSPATLVDGWLRVTRANGLGLIRRMNFGWKFLGLWFGYQNEYQTSGVNLELAWNKTNFFSSKSELFCGKGKNRNFLKIRNFGSVKILL